MSCQLCKLHNKYEHLRTDVYLLNVNS